MTEGRKRGRPRLVLSREDEVELMVVMGMAKEDIAEAFETDVPTLEKNFHVELADGVGRKHREVLGLIMLAAKKGNVAAQKVMLSITDMKRATAQLEKPIPVRLQPGKKEQAANEAQTAGDGTAWERYLKDDDSNGAMKPN